MNIQQEMILALEMAIKEIGLKSLSPSLREKIEQLYSQLSQNNYKAQEIEQKIYDILDQDSTLDQAYQESHRKVTQDYSSQEKDKLIPTPVMNESSTLAIESIAKQEETNSQVVRKAEALSILQALDYHVLTIKDLKYRLNLPENEVISIVKMLWKQRKINKVSENALSNFFPINKRRELVIEDINTTHFTLTFLGRLQLHPIINL